MRSQLFILVGAVALACAGETVTVQPAPSDGGSGGTSSGGTGLTGTGGDIGQSGEAGYAGEAAGASGVAGVGGSAGNLAAGAGGDGWVDLICECAEDRDCFTGRCIAGTCELGSVACTDGVQNGAETDVDCGGPICPPCAATQGCLGNADCADGRCSSCRATCTPPSCRNGVQDGEEWAVDCGPLCDEHDGNCGAGACTCDNDRACYPGRCVAGACEPSSCTDAVRSGAESDVDCGGPDCPRCVAGQVCVAETDCEHSVCGAVLSRSLECGGDVKRCQAATCDDAVQNGDETDADCGGSCGPCENWDDCLVNEDCESGVCLGEECQAPRCWDCVQNGLETGLDCGGDDCTDCVEKWEWYCCENSDCPSNSCLVAVCRDQASCTNQWIDGEETDLDCGGTVCAPCPTGATCNVGSDCVSAVCTAGTCAAPSSSDGVQNNCETDVDCGGPLAPECGGGTNCRLPEDCSSNSCTASVCMMPTCLDGWRNGTETLVDCGGPSCSVCGPNTCSDSVVNGSESDLDCGGICPPCGAGQACTRGADCQSRNCIGGVCQPAACSDSIHNGTETDLDCGGNCAPCPVCSRCATGSDCLSGLCLSGACAAPG